jgi:hypothetical protein
MPFWTQALVCQPADNQTFGCIDASHFFRAVAKLIVFHMIKKKEKIDTCLIRFIQEQDTTLVKLRTGGKVVMMLMYLVLAVCYF